VFGGDVVVLETGISHGIILAGRLKTGDMLVANWPGPS
jgi:hypothetical protein